MEASWRDVLYCSCAGVKPWVSKWSISWLLQQEELSHNCIQWQEKKPNSLLNSLWSLYIQNRRTQYGGFFLIKVCECCLHLWSASELETKLYLWKLLFMYLYAYILGGRFFFLLKELNPSIISCQNFPSSFYHCQMFTKNFREIRFFHSSNNVRAKETSR